MGGSSVGCVMQRGGVQAVLRVGLGSPYAVMFPAYIACGGGSKYAIANGWVVRRFWDVYFWFSFFFA